MSFLILSVNKKVQKKTFINLTSYHRCRFLPSIRRNCTNKTNPCLQSLPSINVNLAGLAIGGAVVAATVVGIPLFMKTFAALHPEQRYSRGKTTSVTLITFIALDQLEFR